MIWWFQLLRKVDTTTNADKVYIGYIVWCWIKLENSEVNFLSLLSDVFKCNSRRSSIRSECSRSSIKLNQLIVSCDWLVNRYCYLSSGVNSGTVHCYMHSLVMVLDPHQSSCCWYFYCCFCSFWYCYHIALRFSTRS